MNPPIPCITSELGHINSLSTKAVCNKTRLFVQVHCVQYIRIFIGNSQTQVWVTVRLNLCCQRLRCFENDTMLLLKHVQRIGY